MRTIAAGFLIIILLLLTACGDPANIPEPPANAESNYVCDVRQGFAPEKDVQTRAGFINFLKIGDRELEADFDVSNPEDVTKAEKVVGVVSAIYWGGDYEDPINFSCQVSNVNKNTLSTMVHTALSNTEVEFMFTIYDFDPESREYFRCFHTNGETLRGLVYKSGGELQMNIDMVQSSEVVSPKNYTFNLGVLPQDIYQTIYLATSTSNKLTKKWGVAVSGGINAPTAIKPQLAVLPGNNLTSILKPA